MRRSLLCCFVACALCVNANLFATVVIAPDNGNGTATMPPNGSNYTGDLMQISAGLPAGSTVDMVNPLYGNFSPTVEAPGGTLGGTTSLQGAFLNLSMVGTGVFCSYTRSVLMPLANSLIDFAPRVGFAPVQSFACDLMTMQGQLPSGDPDFDLLRITAGTNFGLPGPGVDQLTDIGGGNWNVYSDFTTFLRIDFVGHPGGPFGGMSGSSTQSVHFVMGEPVPEPAVIASGLSAALLLLRRKRT